ncbi:hypothetical protein [Klebsiella pneumoniae]|uniref:hypothetical protein n=1 Tax=Klebsiella pneumoniae TaxID=573 RepID=UPI0013310CC8|nr:hypothetical protein [Klebsiella pneumoniae]
MNIETVNELIASLESAGELSIREQKFLKLAKAFKQLAAENKRLTDVAQGGAFVMQKALMKYEFGVGMTMQAEDFIRDAREKHSATDRIFAETEARGVEKFAAHLRANDNGASVCKMIALGADDFAKQLREGAK